MRIASAIQHAPNSDFVLVQVIIDRERKSFREHSMITEDASMRAGIKSKGFNVRVKRFEKILTNAAALPLIKAKAIEQVDLSETEDSKRHASFAALRRIRFLASQSLNFALPFSIARSASRNA